MNAPLSSLKRSYRIAIVGAGFAGLAAALQLARDGHRVRVFEKFAKPKPVGAGILIQPIGLAALRSLGLEDEIVRNGARIDRLWGINHVGNPVVNLEYANWRKGAFGIGLHRGVLFNALWQHALSAGVAIETNHTVADLSALTRSHELVVIADGTHSRLREQTGIPLKYVEYPWGAVWAVLDDPDGSVSRQRTLLQWYERASKMLGIMPTGVNPESGRDVVSLFWSLPERALQTWRAAGVDAWKAEALKLSPESSEVVSQISRIDQLTWARYADVVMARFHHDSVVVIGDAAHATSPQLGQGTNLALVDAVTLARCVREENMVHAALARYTQQRIAHTRYYSQASRLLTPLFQSDQKVLPWLRDQLMARTSAWPILREANLQTLVGTRGGWLRGEMTSLVEPNQLTHALR